MCVGISDPFCPSPHIWAGAWVIAHSQPWLGFWVYIPLGIYPRWDFDLEGQFLKLCLIQVELRRALSFLHLILRLFNDEPAILGDGHVNL